MNKSVSAILFLLFIAAISCHKPDREFILTSPDKSNIVTFGLSNDGRPFYTVSHSEKLIIDTSYLAVELTNESELFDDFRVLSSSFNSYYNVWQMPWGEQSEVKNNYNELKIDLQENGELKRKLNLRFRAFDDGIAFRYEFPKQGDKDSISIKDEKSEFKLTNDHTAWWIPGDWDSYEHLYNESKFSDIDVSELYDAGIAKSYIPYNAVNTPVTLKTSENIYLSFHEANLTDYAGMTLKAETKDLKFVSQLVGSERSKHKVKTKLPTVSPWRTLQIADSAPGLISSKMILNLNEANILNDVSWIKPKKYMGIWWEIHLGRSTWDYGMTVDKNGNWTDSGKAHGRHAATTENVKKYIDFASENNIGGILAEGWNTGWENDPEIDRNKAFDFVTPYPDFKLAEITEYAKNKGVEIIMHHETYGNVLRYEEQLDTAFAMMNKLGIHTVKTGYVGKIIPEGEYHHGQWMVNHYRKVIEKAAKYKIAVNTHEPVKPTGIRRTFPNYISSEGLRGQEFNAWSSDGGNPPEHLTIVAFTRMLAGPVDFTPGVFDISLPEKKNNQVNTTLAHQLALYVIIYSPVQMACDLPENYKNHPGFEFIKNVGVDWEQTVVLSGEIGDYVSIAREERNTGNWFVGSISDEKQRDINVDFGFLEKDKKYRAVIYCDGKSAHFKSNPLELTVLREEIDSNTKKSFKMAPGGGFAISLVPVQNAE